jgi:DNA-directed RNA polymerase specialized sigma subunit
MPRKSLVFIPKSQNFSAFSVVEDEEDLGFIDEQEDFSNGKLSDINAEQTLLEILSQLKERHKIILCFQLLRETGYNISHADFAKTLGISRVRYMVTLKDVKTKTSKLYSSINKIS